MDWTTIISAAVAAISAGGGIGIFFDRKHKKRAAELANESTVSSQWKELYERSEAKVNSQSDKIEGLYDRRLAFTSQWFDVSKSRINAV